MTHGRTLISLGVATAAFLGLGLSSSYASDIFSSIQSGNIDEVKAALKDNPAAVRVLDHLGHTPLYQAAAGGYHSLEIVDLLLRAGADASWHDTYGQQPIQQAALFATPSVLALLVAHGADVNAADTLSKETPLLAAAKLGKDANVQWLLNHNANVRYKDESGETVLHKAARATGDHADMITLLVRAGADVHVIERTGDSALRTAAMWQNRQCAQRLVDAGASWDIFAASALNEVGVVKQLIARDPSIVNSRDGSAQTPLHLAATFGATAVAELLLSRGAKVDAVDWGYGGSTPLYRAVQNYRPGIVEVLVRYKARLDIKGSDNSGQRTPLELAREKGYADIVSVLEKAGPTH
jgi:ankyrin repeat protein